MRGVWLMARMFSAESLLRGARRRLLIGPSVLTLVVAGGLGAVALAAGGPVPTSILPVREPVTYTTGAEAGRSVAEQNGLLGTYYNGRDYDALKFQQVDSVVDFNWGGSDPTTPGESSDWSIVWEGYLDAPTAGDYVLGTTSDDGSWIQMKDGAGNLVTPVDNGGNHGSQTRTTVRTLAAGRQYIRVSYYNGPCCGSMIKLLWQPPGAGSLVVIPSSALWTQGAPLPVEARFGQDAVATGYSQDPVNTATGNYTYQRADIAMSGRGGGVSFARAYNSLDTRDGPLGIGWTHTWHTRLEGASPTVRIVHWNGRADTYTWNGSTYLPPPGVLDTLTQPGGLPEGAVWLLTRADYSKLGFDSAGKLKYLEDRNANRTVLV